MHFSVISWQKSTVTVGLHTSSVDPSTSGHSGFSWPASDTTTPGCLSSSPPWPDEPSSEEGDGGLDVRSMLAETGGGWGLCTSRHTCWERKERFCHSSDIQTFSWLRSLSSFSFSHTWVHKTQFDQVSVTERLLAPQITSDQTSANIRPVLCVCVCYTIIPVCGSHSPGSGCSPASSCGSAGRRCGFCCGGGCREWTPAALRSACASWWGSGSHCAAGWWSGPRGRAALPKRTIYEVLLVHQNQSLWSSGLWVGIILWLHNTITWSVVRVPAWCECMYADDACQYVSETKAKLFDHLHKSYNIDVTISYLSFPKTDMFLLHCDCFDFDTLSTLSWWNFCRGWSGTFSRVEDSNPSLTEWYKELPSHWAPRFCLDLEGSVVLNH